MKRLIILFMLIAFGIGKSAAYVDPPTYVAVMLRTKAHAASLASQSALMSLQGSQHLLLNKHVDGTKKYQETFNNYLDAFSNAIEYAAQIYGFYNEVSGTIEAITELNVILKKPCNALATAISNKRGTIVMDIVNTGMEVTNDVYNMFFNKKMKMTEKQRMDMLLGIRPKLAVLKNEIKHLARVVKYTTFAVVWQELVEISQELSGTYKQNAAKNALARWRIAADAVQS